MKSEIIAGDFKKGTPIIHSFGTVILATGFGVGYSLKDNVSRVEMVTEENRRRILGSAAWGLIGTAILPGIGTAAGLILGGRTKSICFACYLKDGKKFLGISSQQAYQTICGYAIDGDSYDEHPEDAGEDLQEKKDKKTLVECIKCGQTFPLDFSYCQNCGAKNEYIKCGNCGLIILNTYRFCPKCGEAVK